METIAVIVYGLLDLSHRYEDAVYFLYLPCVSYNAADFS